MVGTEGRNIAALFLFFGKACKAIGDASLSGQDLFSSFRGYCHGHCRVRAWLQHAMDGLSGREYLPPGLHGRQLP